MTLVHFSYIYKNLDVRSVNQTPKANAHLKNPLNDEIGYFRSRQSPLTGDEQVEGKYLTIHLSTHDDMVLLLSHDSLLNLDFLHANFFLLLRALVGRHSCGSFECRVRV